MLGEFRWAHAKASLTKTSATLSPEPVMFQKVSASPLDRLLLVHSDVVEHEDVSIVHSFNRFHGFLAVNVLHPLDWSSKKTAQLAGMTQRTGKCFCRP